MKKCLIRSFLLGSELSDVELEFLAFENVTISSAGLSRSGGDASEDSLRLELIFDVLIESLELSSLFLLLDVSGALLATEDNLVLLEGEIDTVVNLVPFLEGGGIDFDDGVLDKSLGSDQLVVSSVVLNVNDLHLEGEMNKTRLK